MLAGMTQTTRDLFFECVGTGYGRTLPTGTTVTVTPVGDAAEVAAHIEGAREYRALVNGDDYR